LKATRHYKNCKNNVIILSHKGMPGSNGPIIAMINVRNVIISEQCFN